VIALVGAWLLGPRRGKYNADGTPNAIPGHNIPMALVARSSCASDGSASTPARRWRGRIFASV